MLKKSQIKLIQLAVHTKLSPTTVDDNFFLMLLEVSVVQTHCLYKA